jgi:hypothetical protein
MKFVSAVNESSGYSYPKYMFPLDFSPRFCKYFVRFNMCFIEDAALKAASDDCTFQESQDGQEIHREGVVTVTFLPHYTHRLQPIDIAVVATFKAK